jgi:hypothetical protein
MIPDPGSNLLSALDFIIEEKAVTGWADLLTAIALNAPLAHLKPEPTIGPGRNSLGEILG